MGKTLHPLVPYCALRLGSKIRMDGCESDTVAGKLTVKESTLCIAMCAKAAFTNRPPAGNMSFRLLC